MANFRDIYTWRYPFLSSMRTTPYKLGVRSGRSWCPRTILYRTNDTNNCANSVACMKILELFLVLWDPIMHSTVLLLASWGRGAVLRAGRDRHSMVRVKKIERWISV